MSPAADNPLRLAGFEQLPRIEQDRLLLDAGYMLLQKHSRRKKVTDDAGRPVYELIPIIRAKYQARREWYPLENTFATIAARDRRLALLLLLPNRIERLF